ncbi:MAG: pilus assembly protein N-terminal domain-containing protein [Pyrinomonadaceae bacterium]
MHTISAGIRGAVRISISILIGVLPIVAQRVVELPKMVLEAKHTEYATTQNVGAPILTHVLSSNPSVATASVYRSTRVQIVAKAPGKTNVEFFDSAENVQYRLPVWVTAPDPIGGGGSGYDPRLTQLDQIVMLVNRTENAHTRDDASARISGVTSSNPSVATARTDPPRGIQIYSKALGDTWVNFTDNATGATYQVHVWVRNKIDTPTPSPVPGPKPGPKPKPIVPTPDPDTGPNGKIDQCLVGTWRSLRTRNSSGFHEEFGAGIVIVIRSNGAVSIDYDGMEPLEHRTAGDAYAGGALGKIVETETWRGSGSGMLVSKGGTLVIKNVTGSTVTHESHYVMGDRDFSWPKGGLGTVLDREGPLRPYVCGNDTLTIENKYRFTFLKHH